ncbi:CD276 antigen-like [Sardina pilchardus]|uniref:CD276 antigen-like n=1 Tax=Sardina pilchardus TaxID=27697 RepID=UPI002E121305
MKDYGRLGIVIIVFTCCGAAFEVRVPQKQVVAVHGFPAAILGCTFTPPPSLQDVVVTWQRVEDLRVVHSFYYGTDQLDRQSADYKSRTSLYREQLSSGNATLRLAQVSPRDTGHYLCSVSTSQGSDKADVQLSYAAFFSEPRLSILAHSSNFTLQYESEGYPQPEVQWRDGSGQNLTHNTQVLQSDVDPGLLKLQTQVVVDMAEGLNWTLTVVNHPLGQVIQRPVSFIYDDQRNRVDCNRERLALLCPIAFCVIGSILLFWVRQPLCSILNNR